MNHDWHQLPQTKWPLFQCSACRLAVELRSGETAVPDRFGECPGRPDPPGTPLPSSTPAKLGRYARAVLRWQKAGRPVRPRALVRQIYNEICTPCPRARKKKGKVVGCRLCGCRVSANGRALVNKIRMATEKCPARPCKWRALVEVKG